MKKLFLFLGFLLTASFANAGEPIRIVTTTSTFASIAEAIVQDEATIHYVASPKRDAHFVSPTPKDVLKVKKADVFIHGGLDLELWRDPLLEAAGNQSFLNGENSINASEGISLLQVPVTTSRSEGDIHVHGNPHYWTDPMNGKIIADTIATSLSKLYPEKASLFEANKKSFQKEIDSRMKEWDRKMKSFKDKNVIAYHKTWPYFAKRFNFNIVEHIEPKPGIAPTAKHLAGLLETIEEKNVSAILRTVHHESRSSKKLSKKTGVPALRLAEHVRSVKEASDYISMIDYNISLIEKEASQG